MATTAVASSACKSTSRPSTEVTPEIACGDFFDALTAYGACPGGVRAVGSRARFLQFCVARVGANGASASAEAMEQGVCTERIPLGGPCNTFPSQCGPACNVIPVPCVAGSTCTPGSAGATCIADPAVTARDPGCVAECGAKNPSSAVGPGEPCDAVHVNCQVGFCRINNQGGASAPASGVCPNVVADGKACRPRDAAQTCDAYAVCGTPLPPNGCCFGTNPGGGGPQTDAAVGDSGGPISTGPSCLLLDPRSCD